jgi:N-formylglutamate deformylase
LATVWQPYHEQLQGELDRLAHIHGRVVLWDAHSIRSEVPRFFEGRLPDFNFGTANGASCDSQLASRLLAQLLAHHSPESGAPLFTGVLNGRFKGGHITRSYGQPARNIHAIQLELAQCTYMDESWPFTYLPERAAKVQAVLKPLLQTCLDF